MSEQVWLVVTGALATGVALVALLLSARAHRRATRAEAYAAALAERLAVLESPPAQEPVPVAEPLDAFVITRMHESGQPAGPVARDIDGRLFADIVARETVVKAASWTHGLRRALSPETRNRIRFAIRQETKRSGRERKDEMREALRQYRARADVREDVA